MATLWSVAAGLAMATTSMSGCSGDPPPTDATLPAVDGSMQIELSGIFLRSTGDDEAELYFSLDNSGGSDRLVSVDAPWAAQTTILGSDVCDNSTEEVSEQRSLEVPALSIVVLRVGGCRVELAGFNEPLRAGQSMPMTLAFAGSLAFELEVPVKGV